MKYGESLFDILYLLFTITAGIIILIKARNKTEKMMGIAALILGCGDAFHLVPRVLNYFVDADFTAALGIGKLVTSITMTVFYIILWFIGLSVYNLSGKRSLSAAIITIAAIRAALCLFPQNGWIENSSDMTWGIIRNIPFVALGIIVIILFFNHQKEIGRFRLIWLWSSLSFAFYIPVAVFAGIVPILGMLMLPKTICYIIIVFTFLLSVLKDDPVKNKTTVS
jgi:hypothetical protein